MLIVFFYCAKAQNGYNFQPLSVGYEYGATVAWASNQSNITRYANGPNFSYYLSPFFRVSFESQFGTLKGGLLSDDSEKVFSNDYKAFLLTSELQAGEVIDYGHSPFLFGLKDLYLGTGIGLLNNKITYIQLTNPADGSFYPYYPQSSNLFIPLKLGYDIKVYNAYDEPYLRVDLSYAVNTVFGDGLDGYATGSSDIKFYKYVSVGVKYCFGNTQIYRKPLRY